MLLEMIAPHELAEIRVKQIQRHLLTLQKGLRPEIDMGVIVRRASEPHPHPTPVGSIFIREYKTIGPLLHGETWADTVRASIKWMTASLDLAVTLAQISRPCEFQYEEWAVFFRPDDNDCAIWTPSVTEDRFRVTLGCQRFYK